MLILSRWFIVSLYSEINERRDDMNYLDMPIWQINQLVHNYVECKGNYRVTFENHKCQWIDKKTGETFEFKMNEAKEKLKDKRYCSDINIAWPIIL